MNKDDSQQSPPTAEEGLEPSLPQNEPEPGSPAGEGTVPSQKGQSEEERVPVSRLRDLQSQNDRLRAELDSINSQLSASNSDMGDAVGKYREALLEANPGIPPELLGGSSIAELDEALAKARVVVEKVKAEMGNLAKEATVPAGAPARGEPSTEGMTPKEKIAYGIQQKGGTS